MRIAVCDDEKESRDIFAKEIKALYPGAALFCYSSGEELLLSGEAPDIVLMDIRMPGKNGMEIAGELRQYNKKAILIFVSALEDYVFQAFDVGAFHYLVKPVDAQKLEEVLSRAIEQLEDREKREGQKSEGQKSKAPNLMVTAGGKHIAVKLEEMVYAEVFGRKIMLHTIDSDIEYYGKMKELQEKAGDEFYRTHRAFLVNFNFVRKYDAGTVYLEKGQALMAKQNYHDFVKSYLRFNQRKGRK